MEDNRKRYECNCPCGKIFYATKSIMQEWGILDRGHGSCPQCKTFYNLTFDEQTEKMILTLWDDFVKDLKEKMINER